MIVVATATLRARVPVVVVEKQRVVAMIAVATVAVARGSTLNKPRATRTEQRPLQGSECAILKHVRFLNSPNW
jgi:hypothetical protein